jgi:hypothetical protein
MREIDQAVDPGLDRPVDGTRGTDLAALESDVRQARMDRVAVLYGEITAATREFLRALAESDRHRDWAAEGFGSCAEWLSWRIGVTRNTANEKVRAAKALEDLPLISEAMARGEISFSKVRALTRAATPANEAELLAYAKAGSAANLERLVRGWKTLGRVDEARAERLRHRMRSFSVFPSGEGMYVVRGLVTPEVAAVLMRAVEAASDALFAGAAPGRGSGADEDERPEPEQLRADALGLVAERALAAGFGRGRSGAVASEHEADAPISGSRGERYQVVLYVEPATLRAEGEPGMSELEDGTRVTAETARRLACDAGRVTLERGSDGEVAGASRRTRTIPPALRRALEARDRGCRFPGCGLRFTDAHHIEHWADGGETTLRNTVLLCHRHHRRVHEDGYQVFSDAEGRVVFFTPRGRAIAGAPPMSVVEAPLPAALPPGAPTGPTADASAALVARNRERGIEPDWRSGLPTYRRDNDIPWGVELAAVEAIATSALAASPLARS